MFNSNFFEIILIGLVLSADSFSAALAMGYRPFTSKDALRFALASGTAEALVALVGALAGQQVIQHFSAYDHWVAFSLLALVAGHMALEGLQELRQKKSEPDETQAPQEFHSFAKVVVVSFATSLDAFGVGIGLGIANKTLAPFIVSIGLWAFVSTIVGLHLARKLSVRFGPIANLFGAVVLAIMAVQMLKI